MSLRSMPRSAVFTSLALCLALAIPLVGGTTARAESIPGTRPATDARMRTATVASAEPGGLHVVVNDRGRISKSASAVASSGAASAVTVQKPAGATVRSAYLATATTGFTAMPLSTGVRLAGVTVPLDGEIPTSIQSWNYFADVTQIVKPVVDAAPDGTVSLSYDEPEASLTDGSILTVIFDDPAVHADESVTLLYGALKTTGDTYQVKLESPVRSSDPGTKLEMALGISFSYQTWGTQQYSTIDVNGRRLSTAAGGEDDGYSSNGGLITVGGLGDDRANPDSPDATPTSPRSDDELYDLRPFVADGATSITIDTSNPSNDDNVFFAAFEMNPPVTSISNNQEKFVYVALGDSYQSGEGTGYSTRGLEAYLNDVFENGSNYPNMVGPQENTYLNDTQGAGVTGTPATAPCGTTRSSTATSWPRTPRSS